MYQRYDVCILYYKVADTQQAVIKWAVEKGLKKGKPETAVCM